MVEVARTAESSSFFVVFAIFVVGLLDGFFDGFLIDFWVANQLKTHEQI